MLPTAIRLTAPRRNYSAVCTRYGGLCSVCHAAWLLPNPPTPPHPTLNGLRPLPFCA